jgi:hypothetical protein
MKFTIPDSIELPIMLIAPERVMDETRTRTADGAVNRRPTVLFGTITLTTENQEVDVEWRGTPAAGGDKRIGILSFAGADGRWRYFDEGGFEVTWSDIAATYIQRFGTAEHAIAEPPDSAHVAEQLLEGSTDALVVETYIGRRAVAKLPEIQARGTVRVINPGEK